MSGFMLEMLLKRNLLENLTIISSSGTVICVLLNYITNVSLITGIWFPLYILVLFIISVFLSFKCIQCLLRLNKPIKYDLDAFVKEYPYLAFLKRYLPEPRTRVPQEWKEYDTNELSVISTVLERKLVSSWYVPYVSQEIGFPFACKQMLDQMIEKAFKICNKIETKDVFVDMCALIITHMREYKKALKRQEKSPNSTIESLYRTSHPISEPNSKYTTADHCTNILRILMKELLPWELWDTPHSELLVRILSKRLDMFIECTLVDPAWLNDKLMTYLTGEEYIEPDKEEKDVTEEVLKIVSEPIVVPEVNNVDAAEEVNAEEEVKMESIVEEQGVNIVTTLDIKSSPVLRQKRGRQGRNEVKIYDRIIEGSVKTWETDMDLQCISLGQDLLASLDGEITLSRLWGQDGEAESSPERQGGKSPQPLWFGEEEALEAEGARAGPAAADVLRELHSTVAHAKHKMGGLQDEAAGMMEGLLDFGIAGLKKGLRFTGLSDDSQQDKSPSHRDTSNRSSPEARHKAYPIELATYPILQKDGENGNGSVPHLVKQQRVISQDSVPLGPAPTAGSESPEPQYEEAADLPSSIAKLRCLLKQRADPAMPSRAEDMVWRGAEETRGRTQEHHSSRPVDSATLADEYDMSMERNASPNQGSNNNMQRLDKLFQRTVTGVFNSLKTAVGGDEAAPLAARDWSFVGSAAAGGAGAAAARLLAARRVHARREHKRPVIPVRRKHHHDSDDIEECFPAWSGALGALGAARPAPHAAARLAAALLADVAESIITSWLDDLAAWLRKQVFAAFEGAAEAPGAPRGGRVPLGAPPATRRPVDLERTLLLLLDRVPALHLVFGSPCVDAWVSMAAGGGGAARDVAHRALDLAAIHLLRGARGEAD